MRVEQITDYIKTFVRTGNTFKNIEILSQQPCIRYYVLTEFNLKYQMDRKVFLLALRHNLKNDNAWFVLCPTLNFYKNLEYIGFHFREVWNFNPENRYNLLEFEEEIKNE